MEQNITINERITEIRNKRKAYINDYNVKMEAFEKEMFKLYEEKYSVDNVINKLLCYDIIIYDKGYDEKYTSWYTLMSQNGFSVQKVLNKLFDYNKNYKISFNFFVPYSSKVKLNYGLRYSGKTLNIDIKLNKSSHYEISNIMFSDNDTDDIYFEKLENNPHTFSFNEDIEKLVDRIVFETNQESIYGLINMCKE